MIAGISPVLLAFCEFDSRYFDSGPAIATFGRADGPTVGFGSLFDDSKSKPVPVALVE